jgi:AraC-like DNA-binding protein
VTIAAQIFQMPKRIFQRNQAKGRIVATWIQPLSNFTVLETDDLDGARAAIATIYGDVTLNPVGRNGSFSTSLSAVPVGPLLITAHVWGQGVDASAPRLDESFEFCSVIQGRADVRVGRCALDCTPERGCVLAPIHPMTITTKKGMSLNVKVPGTVAEAQVRALTGNEIHEPLDFEPEMPLQGEVAGVWGLVRYLAAELERNPSLLGNPLIMERFADTLLTYFLTSQPSNYSQGLRREALPTEPRYVRLVEEYLEAHCDQPVTARDLAEVSGVSMSALYAGFKRHRSCPPLDFLNQIRLRRVRDALLMGPPGTTVKEVGLRWGFNNPSRLSRAYGRRFGETPSETLRRAAKRQ